MANVKGRQTASDKQALKNAAMRRIKAKNKRGIDFNDKVKLDPSQVRDKRGRGYGELQYDKLVNRLKTGKRNISRIF